MSTGRKHKEYLYRAHLMGGSTTVPADRARDVITELHTRMSYTAMGKALGSSHTYVASIARGKIKRISPQREAAILGLRRYVPSGSHHVTPLGAQRRLRALHALGWTWVTIAALSGASLSVIKTTAAGKWPVIEARHDQAIRDVYDRLSMRLPSPTTPQEKSAAGSARNKSKERGWLPPLMWDNPDDPSEHPEKAPDHTPDPVVIDRILGGDMTLARTATKAERVEVVARWRADGRTLNELERATGWEPRRYLRATQTEDVA